MEATLATDDTAIPRIEQMVTQPPLAPFEGKEGHPEAQDAEQHQVVALPIATLLCSGCGKQVAKTSYSSAQLKRKGKRKCPNCIGESAPTPLPTRADAQAASLLRPRPTPEQVQQQSEEACTRLVNWLRGHGETEIGSLRIHHYTPTFRGVHTRKRIPKDKVFLSVPARFIITTEDAKRDSALCHHLENHHCPVANRQSWVALFLLEERAKGESSFYAPYLDILPLDLSHLPVLFSSDGPEAHALQGSMVPEGAQILAFTIRHEYERLARFLELDPQRHGHLHFRERFPAFAFLWARLIVMSRIFGFEVVKGVKTEGLVPMADMLNHSEPANTRWFYNRSRQCFQMEATKNFLTDMVVPDTYGRKCNVRYLLNYGFAMRNNDADNQAAIYFQLDDFKDFPEEERGQWIECFGSFGAFDDSYALCQWAVAAGFQCSVHELRAHRFQIKFDSTFANSSRMLVFCRLLSTRRIDRVRQALVGYARKSGAPESECMPKVHQIPPVLTKGIASNSKAEDWSAAKAPSLLPDATPTVRSVGAFPPPQSSLFERCTEASGILGHRSETVEEELAALAFLEAAARSSLSKFPTLYEEDDALLSPDELAAHALSQLPFAVQQCVITRHGEKKILRFWAELHGVIQKALAVSRQPRSFAHAVTVQADALRLGTSFAERYSSYVDAVWKPLLSDFRMPGRE